MRFGKNVLSQNLRTNCDLALYLTLFTPTDLEEHGLPTPLDARPGVGSLRDAGIEQETMIYNRLLRALESHCIGLPPSGTAGRWSDEPIETQLARCRELPAILVQPKFQLGQLRDSTLVRLGVAQSDLGLMPHFEGFIPDLALVEAPVSGDYVLTSTGDRVPLADGDPRLAISLIDVKHAQEANPSYEAEVVLYSILLANWLVGHSLETRYFVSANAFLWTRGGVARGRFQEALDQELRNPVALIEAIRSELEPVNMPIYVQSIRRFFAERLPEVIRKGEADWARLDWHVGPACSSCDWLGFQGWLGPRDQEKVAVNPGSYCYSRALQVDHVSRLPLVTRGSRRLLESKGLNTVARLAATTGSEPVYSQHTTLKADRRSIPGFATAITTSTSAMDPERTDGMLARYADLDIFLTVNFDPGAGLLTGLGLQASFKQHYPYGQDPAGRLTKRWRDRWVVVAKSAEAESSSVLAFLNYLATIFEFVLDDDPRHGGPYSVDTRSQISFWDSRQFEELCLALGRHLPAILFDRQDRLVKALAWIFPPEELQETDYIDERRPAIAFVRDTVRRLVRVPAVHALTMFNVAEFYHYGDGPFRAPDQFYREPLSDTIPRERIYEIWSLNARGGGGVVRWGSTVKVYSQLLEGFARAVDSQVFALSSIVWQLRRDFAARLRAEAPRIQLVVPTWARGVAHDAKLWIAWAKFDSAFGRALKYLLFMADPEEVEASHEGLRLSRILRQLPDGSIEFEVSEDSLNTKIRAPQAYLCLSRDDVPGFLALPVRSVLGGVRLPHELLRFANIPMHKLFIASLERLDRAGGTAQVRLNDFWGEAADDMTRLRQIVIDHLGPSHQSSWTLVPGLGSDVKAKRLSSILAHVGNPPNAVAAQETLRALGNLRQRRQAGARVDVVTPISRVLWEAGALHGTTMRDPAAVDEVVGVAKAYAGLNDSQVAAVQSAASRALTVIWGPPGTGKTKTCAGLLHGIVVREVVVARGRPYAILVTGPTYKAVGELVERLAKGLADDPRAVCKLYAVYAEARDDRFSVPSQRSEHFLVAETIAKVDNPNFVDMVHSLTRDDHVVIVATVTHQCPRIAEQLSKLRGMDRQMLWPLFDFLLIDETSQVDMATAVGPLALLKADFQLVVAGDHLQMPPVIQCDPPVGAEHLVGSLQTYLTQRFNLPTDPLLENYRSNEQIVSYTRRLGYPPDLDAANPNTRVALLSAIEEMKSNLVAQGLLWCDLWPDLLDPSRPVVALTYPDGIAGQANAFEADCVAAIVWLARNCFASSLRGRPEPGDEMPWGDESFWSEGIGVVTPHRAQRAQVVRALQRVFLETDPSLLEGAVDTVERFQGGERHTIVISFGVGDPDVIRGEEGFLMQLERTNVAISRAMGKCIVLMSEEMASHIPDDRKAAASAHALRGVVDEWCNMRTLGEVVLPDGEVRRLTLRWRDAVL